jgi:CHAD domain-containing protein
MRDYARLQAAVLLRRLAFQVDRAAKLGDASAVHDLRVALRRFSRCLRVFAQFFPGRAWKKIRREIAALLDAAGAVRDCDMALALLNEAGIQGQAGIVAQVVAKRRRASRELSRKIRQRQNGNFSRKWRTNLEL